MSDRSPANSLLSTVTFIHLEVFEVHFRCADSQNLLDTSGCASRPRSGCGAVRSFGRGGHLSWRARETSCFGGPKSTLRGRRRKSEWLFIDEQFLGQAQHFGHGGGFSGLCLACCKDLEVQPSCITPLWALKADFVAGTALCRGRRGSALWTLRCKYGCS